MTGLIPPPNSYIISPNFALVNSLIPYLVLFPSSFPWRESPESVTHTQGASISLRPASSCNASSSLGFLAPTPGSVQYVAAPPLDLVLAHS